MFHFGLMILDRNQNYLTLENARESIKKSYIKPWNPYRAPVKLVVWNEYIYYHPVILPESGL